MRPMKPHVYRSRFGWFVRYDPAEGVAGHIYPCDSWAHAIRVANRIARRQARESA